MTARFCSNDQFAACCYSSMAACTSARISPVLDTAVPLVVSVFICLLQVWLRT